jgi:hypothetical protein
MSIDIIFENKTEKFSSKIEIKLHDMRLKSSGRLMFRSWQIYCRWGAISPKIFGDIGPPLRTRGLYHRKFFAKLRRFSAKTFGDIASSLPVF